MRKGKFFFETHDPRMGIIGKFVLYCVGGLNGNIERDNRFIDRSKDNMKNELIFTLP